MRNGLGEDMKVIGRDFHDLAGTWCIVHKIDVTPRWQNKEEVGEDSDFIKRLKEKERWVEVRTGGYVIMHMAGYIDFQNKPFKREIYNNIWKTVEFV